MVIEKHNWLSYHITQDSWPPPRLSHEVTQNTAVQRNQSTPRRSELGGGRGGAGVPVVQFSKSMCFSIWFTKWIFCGSELAYLNKIVNQ